MNRWIKIIEWRILYRQFPRAVVVLLLTCINLLIKSWIILSVITYDQTCFFSPWNSCIPSESTQQTYCATNHGSYQILLTQLIYFAE